MTGGRVLAAALVLALAGGARDGFDRWVAMTDLPPLAVAVGTEVLGRDGTILRAFQVADGRWRLAPGAVDPAYIAALTGYEDRRFRDHAGVDPRAVLRALWQGVTGGRVVSGASTLTMQVARLLEEGPTGTFRGKIRQARVALALERRLSKDDILDLYLRLAPFGGNVEGLRAATLTWFGKEPGRLTPAETALLIALPQAPEARRPDRHPVAARRARDRILDRLAERGVISAASAVAARRESVPQARRDLPVLAPHLAGRLAAVAPPGSRIVTTIDPRLQRAAETLAARAVAGQGGRVSAAMVLADHRTGAILAQVGGAEWTDTARAGFVDLSRAPRSPGSTLKPFVYALAFDDGIAHPETLIEDRPVAFGTWRPQNFDRHFRGTVTAREALAQSLNIPVVTLTEALGPARLLATLRRTGARVDLPGVPGLAVALGGVGISLEDLVQAYAALARMGVPVQLSALPQAGDGAGRIVGAAAAWQVTDMLAGVTPPAGAAPGRIAFKTGTSYGHRDALAVGYDGRHVAGVWLGRADGTPVPGAFGGDLAAPILLELFDRAGPPVALPPPPPSALIVPNAALPLPLQRFRMRGDAQFLAQDAPELLFPPDGADVETRDGLMVRLRGGVPPFTWLANGGPVAVAERDREVWLDLPRGFVALTVLDARGRSATARVRITE